MTGDIRGYLLDLPPDGTDPPAPHPLARTLDRLNEAIIGQATGRDEITAAAAPPVAETLAGPHRLPIVVPFVDDTRINLDQVLDVALPAPISAQLAAGVRAITDARHPLRLLDPRARVHALIAEASRLSWPALTVASALRKVATGPAATDLIAFAATHQRATAAAALWASRDRIRARRRRTK